MAGLAAGLGRGAMTNHWVDLKNADVIMMDGSNAAENHPAAMTWINKAKDERDAKLIVVDPRFTRSASQADLYVPIRSGTDIAFFGGMMKYIIDKDLYHKEYVLHYTNAAILLVPEFKGPADLDGLFSGFVDEDGDGFGVYDRGTWKYQTDAAGNPLRDETLQNPQLRIPGHETTLRPLHPGKSFPDHGLSPGQAGSGLQTVRLHRGSGKNRHHSLCHGADPAHRWLAERACHLHGPAAAGKPREAGRRRECPARGIERPGVNGPGSPGSSCHRICGHSEGRANNPTLAAYIEKETPKTSYWSNKPKFLVSMLKAWWGDHATAENQFAYDYLPKVENPAHHYWISLFRGHVRGKNPGPVAHGTEPGGQRAQFPAGTGSPEETEMDGHPGDRRHGNLFVLAGSRGEAGGYPDRGVHPPGGGCHGEGGKHRHQRAPDPVAAQSGRSPRRGPAGRSNPEFNRPQAEGALCFRSRPVSRSDSASEMGLWERNRISRRWLGR